MTKQKHFYLIRGLIREKEHWGDFVDSLQAEFPDAQITTLDIPGAGMYFDSPSPFTIKKMVEEMRRDFLKTKKENEEASLVAVSLGGMISVEWMRNYPQDFSQATLINTSFGDLSPFYERLKPKALAHLLKVFVLKGRAREARILEIVSNHTDRFDETLDLWEKIDRERPVSVENTFRQLIAAFQFKLNHFRPTIPVQIIVSTFDHLVNADCSRKIAREWKLPYEEHPTGGHDLTTDDPKWVSAKIKGFSSQLP